MGGVLPLCYRVHVTSCHFLHQAGRLSSDRIPVDPTLQVDYPKVEGGAATELRRKAPIGLPVIHPGPFCHRPWSRCASQHFCPAKHILPALQLAEAFWGGNPKRNAMLLCA